MALEQLGPYTLEKTLGRGGMGAVYVGVNRQTGERAAVKVLSAHLVDDPGFRERFKIEVETLKRLLHPNIVQLMGYGEEDGHLFYVMELVQGRSLQDELVSGRRFAWREVARIGIAVAQALKHAHDRGIIHRDLKPANLLLDEQEHVKLADFGIAKLYGGTSVTADGGVLGTADYMAPEQADGKQITSRCDLYSLGSVLYALLAGRPPFVGRSIVEVISALKNDKPLAIRRLAPDTPEEFERIIDQLLDKDPQKRVPTALALMNRLKAMEHALSPETRTMRPEELTEDAGGLDAPPSDPIPSLRDPAALAKASELTSPLGSTDEYRLAGEMPTLVTAGGSVLHSQPAGKPAATQVTGLSPAAAASARTHVAPDAAAEASPPSRPTTFTTVSEAELRHGGAARDADETSLIQWLAIGGLLLLAVAGIGALIYVATREPSADELYARVKSAAENGAEQLVLVEPELSQFLAAYPADARAGEMRQYQDDLELYRLQRRFELRARRSGGSESEGLSAVERAYLEAVQLQASDPGAALARFEALLAVFGDLDDSTLTPAQKRTSEQCLGLARKQIERLQATAAKLEQEQRQALRRQLERASKLAESNRPAAEPIWRGIITLYGNKPWAADLVEQARAALETGT